MNTLVSLLPEIIRGHHCLHPRHRGCVVAIGNFDGVHLAHQHIVQQAAVIAKARQLPLTLIVFEPQPQEFFCRQQEVPPRLSRLREKIYALAPLRVDRIVVLRFNQALATMSPMAFIEIILVQKLGLHTLVIGDDFRFGHRGQGNALTLKQAGAIHGFTLCHCGTYTIDDQRVSSTGVRTALVNGDLELATRLLGRRYAIVGRVRKGQQRGRSIGFPTLNIALQRRVCPLHGVYAVRVQGLQQDGVTYPGAVDSTAPQDGLAAVASVGTRPTVNGVELLLEVYVFDFNCAVYGCEVRVDFVAYLRPEKRYDSLEAMRPQLVEDVRQAKRVLHGGTSKNQLR